MRITFLFLFCLIGTTINAQTSYEDSILQFQSAYIKDHGVVKDSAAKNIHFFPVNKPYKVIAGFTPASNMPWFDLPTSSGKTKRYRIFGWLNFKIAGSNQRLAIYQSEALLKQKDYFNYLFLPFKDATNGKETYETGRYLDLKMEDIKNNRLVIDFNKAYNPYCAYVSAGYSCPIPPKENHLKIRITAGELKYDKAH